MKFLDKILLVVALIVAVASFLMFPFGDQAEENVQQSVLTGSDYTQVAVNAPDEPEVLWPEPTHAEAYPDATYHVFTPPLILYNQDTNAFTFTPFVAPEPEEPFGLELLAIERQLFRVQVDGVIDATTGKEAARLLIFYLPEARRTIRGTVGSSFEEHEFEALSYEDKVLTNPDGTISRASVVSILDRRSGKTVELSPGERLYIPNTQTVSVRGSDPNPSTLVVWRNTGDRHVFTETTGNAYQLDSINSEAGHILVTKTMPDPEKEAVQRQLSLN